MPADDEVRVDPPPATAELPAERTATDGGGAYWRDGAGVWRYTVGGDPVPGARDLLLGDLFDPPFARVGDGAASAGDGDADSDRDTGTDAEGAASGAGAAVRLVPRAWARRSPGHPLTWVYDFARLGGRDDIAVPADVWDERAGEVVAMAAPELHPHNLHGVDAVAGLLGITPSTVRAYVARHQMPQPILRLGNAPVWSRPVLERWLPTRRRHAAAHRSGRTATGEPPART